MCSVIDGVNGTFDFINLGNIRILNQSVDLAKQPTPQQRRVLAQVINSYSDGEFYLDIMTGDNIGVRYYQADYRKVLGDIDNYFENGIRPTGKMYESKQHIINENKDNEEVTFYRFMSEMKGFLGRLLKDPINAQPSKYLKALGFSKTRIINLLMKKDILERNEKILTPDKTGEKKVKYAVTYKVKRKDFERKMKRIHSRYFEKNLPEKQQPTENFPKKQETNGKSLLKTRKELEECEGGATSASNSGQYVEPMGGIQRRKIIYMTEEQIKYIAEHLKKDTPILPKSNINGNIFIDILPRLK